MTNVQTTAMPTSTSVSEAFVTMFVTAFIATSNIRSTDGSHIRYLVIPV